ncbi:MAG: VIT1/CCC1 transporter family protein [bacterium]|nr:VIT1/CCC1 transporter family protein [bacterium]
MLHKIKKHFEDYLSEFVYGGIDGAVTTFAVVAGATGANFPTTIILILGFSNLIADGFSMSVGSYLSSKSDIELMKKRGETIKNEPSPIINGLSTYFAFLLVGFVPLAAYLTDYVFEIGSQSIFAISIGLTALAFISIGYLKSRITKSHLARSVGETLILGAIAAGLAYLLGYILESVITR